MIQSLFGKTVSPHACNCTIKNATTGVFLWIDFVNTIFFGSSHSSSRSGMFYKIVLLKNFGKLTGKDLCQSFFFLEKVAHHQGCNFIKKRLQIKCFNVNFTKLLNTLCRTPPVSVSNFNSTFLILRPHKRYIYVLPALIVLIVLSHFMLLMDAKNKS